VRSYRGPWLWLWLGGLFLALFPFLAAIAIASFVREAQYSLFLNWWMLGACVAFLAAFTCFFGAIRGWSFPPLEKPRFPDIKVEIYGTGAIETEREADTGLAVPVHLRSFNARFISLDTARDARLTVLLYVTLVPGSWGRVAEATCPPPDWALPPALNQSPISMPFALPPGSAVGGQLVYEIPQYYVGKLADPMDARLELWDHVTDRRMSIRAGIGNHDKSEMVPSSGGAKTLGAKTTLDPETPDAEILGTEAPGYEKQASQQDDAGRA
jgi:hypothetical protein